MKKNTLIFLFKYYILEKYTLNNKNYTIFNYKWCFKILKTLKILDFNWWILLVGFIYEHKLKKIFIGFYIWNKLKNIFIGFYIWNKLKKIFIGFYISNKFEKFPFLLQVLQYNNT